MRYMISSAWHSTVARDSDSAHADAPAVQAAPSRLLPSAAIAEAVSERCGLIEDVEAATTGARDQRESEADG